MDENGNPKMRGLLVLHAVKGLVAVLLLLTAATSQANPQAHSLSAIASARTSRRVERGGGLAAVQTRGSQRSWSSTRGSPQNTRAARRSLASLAVSLDRVSTTTPSTSAKTPSSNMDPDDPPSTAVRAADEETSPAVDAEAAEDACGHGKNPDQEFRPATPRALGKQPPGPPL